MEILVKSPHVVGTRSYIIKRLSNGDIHVFHRNRAHTKPDYTLGTSQHEDDNDYEVAVPQCDNNTDVAVTQCDNNTDVAVPIRIITPQPDVT